MKILALSLILFCFLGCKTFENKNHNILSSSEQNLSSKSPILYSDERTLEFTLEATFAEIIKNKRDTEKKYQGTIKMKDGVTIPVILQTRGKTSIDQCEFPKLKIEIPDNQTTAGTVFFGVKKFKLGTHCYKPQGNTMTQRLGDLRAVNRERFTYRIFDLISPVAYKTRKAKISYIFSDAGNETITFPAFILENDGELKNRISATLNNGKPVKDFTSPDEKTSYDQHQAYLCDFFAKLIGHYDWSFSGFGYQELIPQNIYEIEMADDIVTVVPYDFDVTGTVIYESSDLDLIKDTKKIFETSDITQIDFSKEVAKIYETHGDKIKNRKFEPFFAKLAKVKYESPFDMPYIEDLRRNIIDFYFLADNLPEFFNKKGDFLKSIGDAERLDGFKKATETFKEKEKQIREELEISETDEEFKQLMQQRFDDFYKALPNNI